MIHKCPKCGGQQFVATAHVVQSWYVDKNGNYSGTVCVCEEVLHSPNDEDIWECANCGFDGVGSKFLTEA